jgi:L-alanine-DL-glutamate epimerase-like enolase superfamily enzyme
MRITGLETTLFACPAGMDAGCVVELRTDSKHRGIAIAGSDLRGELAALTGRFLLGEDPRAAPALWQRMLDPRTPSARRARMRAAAALLDVALWDLKSKSNAEPLWKTLGGARPAAPVAARCGVLPLAAGAADTPVALQRRFGIRHFIVRLDRDGAVNRGLAAARRAMPRDAELAIDARGARTVVQAARLARQLERRLDPAWIEVKATRGNAAELKKAAGLMRAALCAGRGLGFPADFRTYFAAHSIDLVQVDLGVNGVTGALQLADSAFAFELPVMLCAARGNIHAQLAGAMPYVMAVEIASPGAPAGVLTTDVRIEGGCAIAGDAPGNGLVIDRAALARCCVDRLPARRRAP